MINRKTSGNKIRIWAVLLLSMLVMVMVIPSNPDRVQAKVSKKVYKMLKGKWDKNGERIDGQKRYAKFTRRDLKWYYNGKYSYKSTIVSVKKKSSKKYVFKMRTDEGNEFQYIAYAKKGKFYAMDYWWYENGEKHYSGSSSICRL